MEFKETLKKLRKQKCLTQAALGDILHVSRSAVAKWEAGLGLPNEETIQDICAFFDISREELVPTSSPELLTAKNAQIHKGRITQFILLGLIVILVVIIMWTIFDYYTWIKKTQEPSSESQPLETDVYDGIDIENYETDKLKIESSNVSVNTLRFPDDNSNYVYNNEKGWYYLTLEETNCLEIDVTMDEILYRYYEALVLSEVYKNVESFVTVCLTNYTCIEVSRNQVICNSQKEASQVFVTIKLDLSKLDLLENQNYEISVSSIAIQYLDIQKKANEITYGIETKTIEIKKDYATNFIRIFPVKNLFIPLNIVFGNVEIISLEVRRGENLGELLDRNGSSSGSLLERIVLNYLEKYKIIIDTLDSPTLSLEYEKNYHHYFYERQDCIELAKEVFEATNIYVIIPNMVDAFANVEMFVSGVMSEANVFKEHYYLGEEVEIDRVEINGTAYSNFGIQVYTNDNDAVEITDDGMVVKLKMKQKKEVQISLKLTLGIVNLSYNFTIKIA